jgi:hypothetical protein
MENKKINVFSGLKKVDLNIAQDKKVNVAG